jgi:hypothetical protein
MKLAEDEEKTREVLGGPASRLIMGAEEAGLHTAFLNKIMSY